MATDPDDDWSMELEARRGLLAHKPAKRVGKKRLTPIVAVVVAVACAAAVLSHWFKRRHAGGDDREETGLTPAGAAALKRAKQGAKRPAPAPTDSGLNRAAAAKNKHNKDRKAEKKKVEKPEETKPDDKESKRRKAVEAAEKRSAAEHKEIEAMSEQEKTFVTTQHWTTSLSDASTSRSAAENKATLKKK